MEKLRIVLATLILAVSVLSLGSEFVIEHNKKVESEQFNKSMIAKHGATFSVDDWGINYASRNRHFIFVLCIAAFFLTLWPRTRSLSLLAYALTLPLIYQWITMTMRDLSYNDFYMADSPYVLRIATVFDWTLFTLIALAFVVNAIYLFKAYPRTKLA